MRDAEAELTRLLGEIDRAERERERLGGEGAAFERRWAEATREAFGELHAADQTVRHLGRLEVEVGRLTAVLRQGEPPPLEPRVRAGVAAAARRLRAPEASPRIAGPAPTALVAEPELKALYRRLARLLHPDLARGGEAEARRRSDLMASANAAYARGDRAALELLAERLGTPDAGAPLDDAERLEHARRRSETLAAALGRIAGEVARLGAGRTARLRREEARRQEAGGDLLAEAREGAEADAAAARAAALASLDRVLAGARLLDRAREEALARESGGGRPGPAPRDAAARSPLVRAQVRRGAGPGAAGRAPPPGVGAGLLAKALAEEAAEPAPWRAGLTLLAAASELAGRPPEAIATSGGLTERWEALREGWPGAPELAWALVRLPRHLALGLRLREKGVAAGLQLASADLLPGVEAALAEETVRSLAREVLSVLGPRLSCRRCGADVYAVHLLRADGLEAVHGLVCPRCASPLRTFLRYGPPEGLEALLELSLRVGLVAELRAGFGSATLGFQMLPGERLRVTAAALARRAVELCLAPHGIDLAPGRLAVLSGGRELDGGEVLQEEVAIRLAVTGRAPADEGEILRRVHASVARRFRG